MANPEKHLRSVPTDETTADLSTFAASPSVLASAVRYTGKSPRIYIPPKPWQVEAYRHYGICGEARFAANWIANALSRVSLYAVKDLTSKEKLTTGEAVDALAELFGGPLGQVQMMHALGLHLTIAGEAYIVGRSVEGTENVVTSEAGVIWEVLAVTEVKKAGDHWTITDPENETMTDIPLGDEDVVIRVWRPHPEKRREADSPFRSLLPVLSEIEWATRHIFSQMASRLAGAGLLFVSDGIQIAEAPSVNEDGDLDRVQNTATALMTALATAMMRPLHNPELPEALVPLILTVPEELLKSGKVAELMHFWSDLDDKAQGIRTDAIMRFADGMDIPAEKLKGLSSAPSTGGGRSTGPNHWGMWQIDEEAIKLHIEPAAELIGNFLAIAYLRPLDGVDPLNAVWYDSSALRLRPDRSKESIELYNLGLVKGEVVVRENRFDVDNDMMDDEERKTWLLIKLATGTTSATPEQVAAALSALGVTVPAPAVDAPTEESRGPRALPAVDRPERALPEAANAVLLAAAEPLVFRALERAGNRLKQQARNLGGTPPQVPSYAMHTVVAANGSAEKILEDAFTGTAVECLTGRVPNPEQVIPVLEGYVSTLVMEQSPHTRERLVEWLGKAL